MAPSIKQLDYELEMIANESDEQKRERQLYSAIHSGKVYAAGYPEKFSDFLSSNLRK